jgi:hypothetical protein
LWGKNGPNGVTHKTGAGVNTTSPGVVPVSEYRLFSVKITTGGVGYNTPESNSDELKCEKQRFEMPRLHLPKNKQFRHPRKHVNWCGNNKVCTPFGPVNYDPLKFHGPRLATN